MCLLLYILLASLIDGSASYFEIISGTEHCRDKSSGRFHQSVPSVACNHTRACFASEDIFNNDIIQNMTAIFFFNSYFHIQRHNNVCFFPFTAKMPPVRPAFSPRWFSATTDNGDITRTSTPDWCMGPASDLRGESEGRGIQLVAMCNLTFYMPLNPTHWTFLKGLTLKEFLNNGCIKAILLKYPAYITFL